MFEVTFFTIELIASLIGGLISGLICLVLLDEYDKAGKTVERFAEKINLGKKPSFLILSLIVAFGYVLLITGIRTTGLIDKISLMSSIPLLLPLTIAYSMTAFMFFWINFREEEKHGERNQWLFISSVYGLIFNLISGFLTFLLAFLTFFG